MNYRNIYQDVSAFSNEERRSEKLKEVVKDITYDVQLQLSDDMKDISDNFLNNFRQLLQDELMSVMQKLHLQGISSLRQYINKEFVTLPIFDSLSKQDKDIINKIFSKISQHILQKLIF